VVIARATAESGGDLIMATSVSFKQSCPSCEHPVPIRDPKLIGRKIDCPKCKYRFVVEEPPDEADEEKSNGKAKEESAVTTQTKKGAPAVTGKKPTNGRAPTPPKKMRRRDEDDDDIDDSAPKKKSSGGGVSPVLLIGGGLAGVAVIALIIAVVVWAMSDDTPPKKPEAKNPQPPVEQAKDDKPAGGEVNGDSVAVTNLLPNNTELVRNAMMDKVVTSELGEATFGRRDLDPLALNKEAAFHKEPFAAKFGFPLENIARHVQAQSAQQDWIFNVIRTKNSIDWEKLKTGLALQKGPKSPIDNKDYFVVKAELDPFSRFWFATSFPYTTAPRNKPLGVYKYDDQTLILAELDPLEKFLQKKPENTKPPEPAPAGGGDGGQKPGPGGGVPGPGGGVPGPGGGVPGPGGGAPGPGGGVPGPGGGVPGPGGGVPGPGGGVPGPGGGAPGPGGGQPGPGGGTKPGPGGGVPGPGGGAPGPGGGAPGGGIPGPGGGAPGGGMPGPGGGMPGPGGGMPGPGGGMPGPGGGMPGGGMPGGMPGGFGQHAGPTGAWLTVPTKLKEMLDHLEDSKTAILSIAATGEAFKTLLDKSDSQDNLGVDLSNFGNAKLAENGGLVKTIGLSVHAATAERFTLTAGYEYANENISKGYESVYNLLILPLLTSSLQADYGLKVKQTSGMNGMGGGMLGGGPGGGMPGPGGGMPGPGGGMPGPGGGMPGPGGGMPGPGGGMPGPGGGAPGPGGGAPGPGGGMPGPGGGMPGPGGGMPGPGGGMPGPGGGMPGPGGGMPGPGGGMPGPGGGMPGQWGNGQQEETSTAGVARQGTYLALSMDFLWKGRMHDEAVGALHEGLIIAKVTTEMAPGRPRIHQFAAAIKAYTQKHPGFPMGAYMRLSNAERFNRKWAPDQRISWMAEIVRYLPQYIDEFGNDQGRYPMGIKPNQAWNEGANLHAAHTLVPQFLGLKSPETEWFVQYPKLPGAVAATQFVGIAGIGLDAAEDDTPMNRRGVFSYNHATSMAEITDKPENTIAVLQVPQNYKTPWLAGGGSTVRGVPEKDSIVPFVCTDLDGKRGTYAIMANGDVRFIHDDIPDSLFQAMVTIAGNEPIKKDELAKYAPLIPVPENFNAAPPPLVAGGGPNVEVPANPAGGAPAGWKEFVSQEGGLKVMAPGALEQQRSPFANDSLYRLRIKTDGATDPAEVSVRITKSADAASAKKDHDDRLASRRVDYNKGQWKLKRDASVTRDGFAGTALEVDISVGQSPILLKEWSFVVGNMQYEIDIQGTAEQYAALQLDKVLESLKLQQK
jgi:hypothetical protein